MKPLVYEPERGLQAALGAFLQDKVFIDEDDGVFPCFDQQNVQKPSFSNYWDGSNKKYFLFEKHRRNGRKPED